MSVRKLTARLIGSLVVLCGMASAQAQQHFPVADPHAFSPDWRWFEPIYQADLDDMKPSKRASTGWFGTYDRLNLYGSRPELNRLQTGEERLDKGWGHRYEVGYMLPDTEHGFMFSWVHNNVGKFFQIRHEAANRLNQDNLDGDATNPAPPFGFEAIQEDGNNRGFNYRFFDELDSINVVDFDSFELSKTWRMEPYHYGGILEPMIGFRYFKIKDTDIFQDFQSSSSNPLLVGPNGGGVDQMTTDKAITTNDAITAQIGARYFKFRDRFTFSGEFRVFTGINFQSSMHERGETIYEYDGVPVAIGDDIDRIIRNVLSPPTWEHNEEFFLGFDVRGEVAYQLTRDITIRTGIQVIDVGRGLWRGGFAQGSIVGGDNDQDLQLVGWTGGITLNR